MEGRFICAEFDSFYLISIYNPHAKKDLSRLKDRQNWDQCLKERIEKLQQKKPVVLAGDLNVAHRPIDVVNGDKRGQVECLTDEERAGFDGLLDIGMRDLWRDQNPSKVQYSFWDNRL